MMTAEFLTKWKCNSIFC